MTQNKIINWALIIVSILAISTCSKNLLDKKEQSLAIVAMNDEIKTTKNKLGQETASRLVIQGENEKNLKNYLDSQKELTELAKLLDKKGQQRTGVIVESATSIQTSVPTKTDTIEAEIINYYGEYEDEWITWNGKANQDTFKVDIEVRNKWEMTQTKRNYLFKPSTLKIELKNLNPYTKITEIQSFSIKENQKRLGVGPYLGITPSISATGLTIKPQIGLGLHWDVIKIR